jgi:predicted phosphoribosyltransferase
MSAQFRDRYDAGRQLVARLGAYAGRLDTLVLALPRGGVPVAFVVAWALRAPLDVFLVRKLGVPGHEELAMGAIASGGVLVRNRGIIAQLDLPAEVIQAVAAREREELTRREHVYRAGRPPAAIAGKTLIVVDDGLATGTTMRAAIVALRQLGPAQIVVAVPTASPDTCAALAAEVDQLVCPFTPEPFSAVGRWYEDFSQTTDDEVRDLLGWA